MKKVIWIVLVLVNCITTISPGILVNNTTEHIYPDGAKSQIGTGRIERKVESCSYSTVFVYPFMNARVIGISEIMKENNLKKIGVIDYSSFSFLGPLFFGNCIIIWGE